MSGSPAAHRIAKRQPLVSIVLPTRNRAHSLPAALESVRAQTYTNWELFVIDDGSTDDTLKILAESFSDPRITVIRNLGSGVCAARNCGLRAARGEFVAYLDSDNSWTPRYLELMLCDLERSGAACGYAVLQCINGTVTFYRQEPFDFSKLRIQNFIDLNVFFHRRSLLDECGFFDDSLKRMVDWDFILRCTKNHPPQLAFFIGALYDSGPSPDRITNVESVSYLDVVRNKHWIDWPEVIRGAAARDPALVSIIICVYGQPALTETCLTSLFTTQAGEAFEVILVDNGSDGPTKEVLARWAKQEQSIKLITNPVNFNFALGNNIGFAASRGSRVVFLNNDTEVSPEWLRSLVRPLHDSSVKGTQPKLLFPDGRIQCIGVVFNDKSPLGYPLYVHQPGDFPPTQLPRSFSAITAACMAMRAVDFASARGFDPLYRNGQEDIDLCLRIGGGADVFRCVTEAVVIHHEGKSAGRGQHIEANRRIFCDRWRSTVAATDQKHYAADGLLVEGYTPDNRAWADGGYAVWRPKLAAAPEKSAPAWAGLLNGKTIAIKIGCPKPELKEHWGDYHFAVSLAAAFLKKGVRARIDFLPAWTSAAQPSDINLVLRGLSRFTPRSDTVNLMWLISHPDKVPAAEIKGFDRVFVASEEWARQLAAQGAENIEALLQCTDGSRFYPRPFEPAKKHTALFAANSRKVQRTVTRDAVAQEFPIAVYGEMWAGLIPADWVRAPKIDNVDLPCFYSNAEVVLNDHWDDMRAKGFISNRIFDALACGATVVTDVIQGIPPELQDNCRFFDSEHRLRDVVSSAGSDPEHRSQKALDIAETVRMKHSFDARVEKILTALTRLIGEKSSHLRLPPDHPHGIKRVQVGCGPTHILSDWWNVDIRSFKGIDRAMDVTKPWPWRGVLDYVYGEHFLEHLTVPQALLFLENTLTALKPGGAIRLSTPALEWVVKTHFTFADVSTKERLEQTWAMNRAFHGWGHQFLYSKEMLGEILAAAGFDNIRFFEYGESSDPNLKNLERHGGWSKDAGFPSVWIVEAVRGEGLRRLDEAFTAQLAANFQRYVDGGH